MTKTSIVEPAHRVAVFVRRVGSKLVIRLEKL